MRCMFFISFWLLAKVGRVIIYILQESHIFVFTVHKDLILNSLYISMVFSIIKKSKWTKGTRFAGWMATCHEETYIEEREANGEKH